MLMLRQQKNFMGCRFFFNSLCIMWLLCKVCIIILSMISLRLAIFRRNQEQCVSHCLTDTEHGSYPNSNLFVACFELCKVKSGPFAEHSNQLYNISGVPAWNKVNSGLVKMYKAEVTMCCLVNLYALMWSELYLFLPLVTSSYFWWNSIKTKDFFLLSAMSSSPSLCIRSYLHVVAEKLGNNCIHIAAAEFQLMDWWLHFFVKLDESQTEMHCRKNM